MGAGEAGLEEGWCITSMVVPRIELGFVDLVIAIYFLIFLDNICSTFYVNLKAKIHFSYTNPCTTLPGM